MIRELKDLLGINTGPNPPTQPAGPEAPLRGSADIRAELGIACDSVEPLAAKLSAGQIELAGAQLQFDDAIQAYALGTTAIEPDRGALAAFIAKVDALRRVSEQLQRTIYRLTSELAAAELAETISAGRERLVPLIGSAEAALAEFEQAVVAVRRADKNLFAVLFSEKEGLRRNFPAGEIELEARRARFRINRKAQEIASREGYPLSELGLPGSFELDGNPDFGRADREMMPMYQAHASIRAYEQSALRARMDAAVRDDRPVRGGGY